MKYIIILSVFCTLSCTVQKRDSFSYAETNTKTQWINSFKYEVFYGCIKEGIGNDSLRIILQKKDLFNPNAEVDFVVNDKARSLGKGIIENMPKPYIKIDKGEEDLKNKNFISSNCLKYYASKELDSIAEAEYKKAYK